MKYKLIIWDFNGTVIDDTELSLESINTVLKRRGLKTLVDADALREVFCFPVQDYYRLLGFDFEKEDFKIPADEWVELYGAKKFTCPLCKGVEKVLKKIKDAGVRQIILSASEENILCQQLSRLGVRDYFDEVLGAGDVYAVGKTQLCKMWLDRQNSDEIYPALFIGDTDHDFECAKAIGADCALYSGGFMSKRRLRALCENVFDTMDEIAQFLDA